MASIVRFSAHKLAFYRAPFLSRSLRDLLSNQFNARLAGSWATNEAHLPPPIEDRIRSLSDVDVLVNYPPTGIESAAIARGVRTLARDHGVDISKVSVRCHVEIALFWNPYRIRELAASPVKSGQFLAFWALIGAIEMSSASAESTTAYRAYALMKFFFKLSRNMLLLLGRIPLSYRELALDVFSRLLPSYGVRHAYLVKTGREAIFTRATCEDLLSDSTWEPLTSPIVDIESDELLTGLRKDVRTWYLYGTSLDVQMYFSKIRALDAAPELVPALLKAVSDYERKSTKSTD